MKTKSLKKCDVALLNDNLVRVEYIWEGEEYEQVLLFHAPDDVLEDTFRIRACVSDRINYFGPLDHIHLPGDDFEIEDSIDDLLDDREEVYGSPNHNLRRAGAMCREFMAHHRPLDNPVLEDQLLTAAFMILAKLSRLSHTLDHEDSWDDIIGYARCAQQCMEDA